MSESLFDMTNVSFEYERGKPVLDRIDWRVDAGEFVGVIGPNGAGKSTLLHLATGWLRPGSGSIRYRGRDLQEWSRRSFAREVAVVPQNEDGTFPFTVEQVVLMGRYAHQETLVGFDDPEDRAIARGVLELVGLRGFECRRMNQLSGGERQRVLLARALAQCPKVILLDEPTASLDLSFQRGIFTLLERLNRDHGLTMIAVTHDLNLAAAYCRRVTVLHEARIEAEGPPDELLQRDLLEHVYRVPVSVLKSEDGHPIVTIRR